MDMKALFVKKEDRPGAGDDQQPMSPSLHSPTTQKIERLHKQRQFGTHSFENEHPDEGEEEEDEVVDTDDVELYLRDLCGLMGLSFKQGETIFSRVQEQVASSKWMALLTPSDGSGTPKEVQPEGEAEVPQSGSALSSQSGAGDSSKSAPNDNGGAQENTIVHDPAVPDPDGDDVPDSLKADEGSGAEVPTITTGEGISEPTESELWQSGSISHHSNSNLSRMSAEGEEEEGEIGEGGENQETKIAEEEDLGPLLSKIELVLFLSQCMTAPEKRPARAGAGFVDRCMRVLLRANAEAEEWEEESTEEGDLDDKSGDIASADGESAVSSGPTKELNPVQEAYRDQCENGDFALGGFQALLKEQKLIPQTEPQVAEPTAEQDSEKSQEGPQEGTPKGATIEGRGEVPRGEVGSQEGDIESRSDQGQASTSGDQAPTPSPAPSEGQTPRESQLQSEGEEGKRVAIKLNRSLLKKLADVGESDTLDLSNSFLGTSGVVPLLRSLYFAPNLTGLNLRGNSLQVECLGELRNLLETNGALVDLNLSSNHLLSASAGRQLIEIAKCYPQIIQMDISATSIPPNMARQIADTVAANARLGRR